jgi:uncharacterized protein (DUF1786 family)
MNERIAELMRDHGLHKNISADCQHRIEMLADLIVQECCRLIKENEHNLVPGYMQRMTADAEVSLIKKHFNIK